MKKQLLTVAAGLVLLSMVGCGGGANKLSSKIDLHMLEQPDQVKKVYELVLERMGEQARAVDDVDITVSDPTEKRIQHAGDVVTLWIRLDFLHPSNPNKLQRYHYFSENNGWQAPESVDIDLRGYSNEEKENFVLEESLWNFKEKTSYETLQKVLDDALARKADPSKLSKLFIHSIVISESGYQISIHAKLASNDQEVNENYSYDLDGKQTN
jgi:hypothetical protein